MNSSPTTWPPETVGPQIKSPQRDQAMAEQDATPQDRRTLFERLETIATLSQIIRTFGACAIIASMSLFMLQGWAEGNDITRYLKLLTQTGLLTAAGLVLSFLVKEFKGARVFFGLALVSVVANFTILGSLTYSMFPMDVQIVDYPAAMKWEVAKSALFLPVFLGALSLLSAVAYFGFSIFSRQIAKPLSISFLCLSAVLLLPVRAPLVAVGLAGLTLWGAWLMIKRLSRADKLVMTKETKASLAILLLPGIIILARAASFYSIDEITLLAFSGLLFITLRNAGSLLADHGWVKRSFEVTQFGLGAGMAILLTQVLPNAWNNFDVFIGVVTFAAFAFEQVLNGANKWWKMLATNLTTIAIVPIALLNAAIGNELVYSVQALLICSIAFALTISASNIIGKTPSSRFVAILGMIAATLLVLFDLVQLAQLGNWMIIGLSGAILIIAASFYERFGLTLRSRSNH